MTICEVQGASGRVITGGHDWKCNLDWGPTDVLVLEHGEQQRLTPETLQALGLQGIAAVWKVPAPCPARAGQSCSKMPQNRLSWQQPMQDCTFTLECGQTLQQGKLLSGIAL